MSRRGGRRHRGRRPAGSWLASVLALGLLLGAGTAGPLGAQELADYDYENLGFRGVGFEWGHLVPSSVRETSSVGMRVDLGYLGPGLRVVPSFTYWSSELKRREVEELETRMADLVERESEPGTPRPDVSLGSIEWTDVVLGLDGHFVWTSPIGVLGFAGVGGAAHLMDGKGQAIDGTFVEDLLDSIRAGFNLHGGLEVPVHRRVRVHSSARYELLGDLRYLEFRIGGQLFFGEPAPGEGSGR